jgi:hypothetical protein
VTVAEWGDAVQLAMGCGFLVGAIVAFTNSWRV